MSAPLVAPTIDLSALPAPLVLERVDYEALLDQRRTSLIARFAAAGIDYDVATLETDPAMILQQEDAYRQMIDRSRINDAVRAVLPPFSKGSDLDAVVTRAGITRLVLEPATNQTPAVMESDERLLQRYLAAFGRPAAGSVDGYAYAVFTALPTLHDLEVIGPDVHGRDGRVDIVLLASRGQTVTPQIIATARAAVNARTVRPLTDVVVVRAASIATYNVTGTIHVPLGPDPNVIRTAALASLNAYAASRYRVGRDVPANALAAALYVPNVSRVVLNSPTVDLGADPYTAPSIGTVNLTVVVDE